MNEIIGFTVGYPFYLPWVGRFHPLRVCRTSRRSFGQNHLLRIMASFMPQKVVMYFIKVFATKVFNLFCELFKPILTRSFKPTKMLLVDSGSAR